MTIQKKPSHELVLGMTGSGKTVFSRGALLPAYQEKYLSVIIDTKHDKNDKLWNYADVTVEELKPMMRYLEKGYHVHYRIKYANEAQRWATFDRICHAVMESSGKIVTYVNEGGDVMSNFDMPFWFDEMLRKGRSPECWALVESQRPSLIVHPNLFNNVDSFWLFKMGTKDRSAIKRWWDKEELERIKDLPDFGYIWSDGMKYEPCAPISLEATDHGRRRTEPREPEAKSGAEGFFGVFGIRERLKDAGRAGVRARRSGEGGRRQVEVRIE